MKRTRTRFPIRVEHPEARLGIVGGMSSAGADLRTLRQARPLSATEWNEAERVAARLHGELRRLIARMPEHARHASGMSRHLGVLRATCQRVVQGIQDATPSVSLVTRLPGVEGLRQFLEGARNAGIDDSDIEAVESAVEAFERLITVTGGSLTKLIERIGASEAVQSTSVEGTGVGSPAQREALFLSAAGVTGRRCDLSLSIYAFRRAPDDPAFLERALAKGMIGSVVTPGGMPMVLSSGDTLKGDDEVRNVTLLNREAARGRTPEAIFRPFTTDPLPMVTARGRGASLQQVIDPQSSELAGGATFDVVTAVRGRHPYIDPDAGKPSLDAVWSLVSCPSAKLILDVYLHADMEREFRPNMEALLWTPNLDISEEQRWALRLPAQPKLQLLGRGTRGAASELYPRHAELTRYFFDHIGWDPEEFLGFRCETLFPVWRAGYCMGFEHLSADAAAPTAET